MNLAINAYAIGPDLYDWDGRQWEAEEMRRSQEEERLDADFRLWQRFAYCDRNHAFDKAQIIDYVEDALDMISGNEESRKKFNWLLFNAYCSEDHHEDFLEMVGSYLKTAYCKEQKREAE